MDVFECAETEDGLRENLACTGWGWDLGVDGKRLVVDGEFMVP